MRTQRSVVTLGVIVLGAGLAPAQFAFAPESEPIVSPFTWDVDVADLDADGDLDMVLSDPVVDAGVRVLLNDGSGAYPSDSTHDVGGWGDATAVGDVDGDGDPDLVTAVRQGASLLVTLLNDGAGGFTVSHSVAAGSLPEDVALADLDGDGDLDAVLANWDVDSVSFLYGDGTGAFAGELQIPVSGGNAFAVDVPDLDGDGDADPVVACFGNVFPGGGALHVFDNPGDGVFGAPTSLFVELGAWAVDTGDIDGDGDTDVVTTNRNTDTVSIFVNDGAGNLAPQVTAPVGHFPVDGHLADLDGDGDLDIVAGSNNSSDVHVLANDGSGGFSPALVIPTTWTHYCGAVGDMDGDGDVDVWAGGGSHVNYFQNLAATPDPWVDLGGAVGGFLGEPELTPGGSLAPGTETTLTVSSGLPGATATLVAGLSVLGLPFKGGTLVPAPDVLVEPFFLGPTGALFVTGSWPGGVPTGTSVVLQYWIVDGSGPAGLTATNGVVGTTP